MIKQTTYRFMQRIALAVMLAAGVLFPLYTQAQNARAIARLDTASLLIGGQTYLHVGVAYRQGNKAIVVEWPQFPEDTIVNHIEIIEAGKTDTALRDSSSLVYEMTRSFRITSYDSGYYAIPPYRFVVNGDTLETEALMLEVNTVPVDTSQAFRDIKAPLEVPPPPPDYTWLWWTGGILVFLIVAGFALWMFLKWRKKKNIPPPPPPPVPLHIRMLEQLEQLKAQGLAEKGMVKEFYTALTDILRAYIEERFRVPAMEQTSDEIMHSFRSLAVDDQSRYYLKQILLLADMVKFAKETPTAFENEMSMNNAFGFVKGTTPAYILYGQQPAANQPPVQPGMQP
jgi:hypothetical protein